MCPKLKELSETNKQRISKAKKECETLGGEHQHKDQYDGIPETFTDSHFIHSEPYYRKFTLVLAGKTSHQNPIQQRSSSHKFVGEKSTAWIPMSVTSIKMDEYYIMEPKLTQ